jgi:hypothetical protein
MQSVSRKEHSVNVDTDEIGRLTQRLYHHLHPVSWKRNEVLAKELKVRKEKIKAAKDRLEEEGKIYVRYFRNGNRPNPWHETIKVGNPIYKHMRVVGLSLWRDLDKMNMIEMYLKSGWDILPFRDKHPAVKNVDEWLVRHRSIDQVLDHFDKHPDMNVGMRVRGLTVIDSDRTEIPDKFCGAENFCDTLTARTARGYHFYFQRDPVVRTSVKVLDEKTDTRCDGSFVVLPPSIHPTGAVYTWHQLAPVQTLPIQVRRVWRENEFRGRGASTGFLLPHEIPEGMRNDTLFRYGRSLRRQGLTEDEVVQELRHVNSTRCVPRLGFAEIDRLIRHVWTYADRR